jgi:RNA polymerase sigma-54 factor
MTTMLPKESSRLQHVDPLPPFRGVRASDVLEQSPEALAALVHRYQEETLCIKRTTRIRRAGPMATAQVDLLPAPGASLAEHLSSQLRMGQHDDRLIDLAEWIIWNLDPDGYLREDLCRLAAMAGADVTEAERALVIVHSLDPTGVGARSLEECLLLQLRAQVDPDPVALRLVDGHLKALAEKRYDDIARALRQPTDRIMQALAAIRRLEPRPGRPFGDPPAQTVRPEVAIEKVGDDYRVVLRDDDVARVRVTQQGWAEAAAETGETRRYLGQRLQAASWLVTAVERRRHTVRGVVQSIVRRQPDFLEHGPAHLRPLSLREVAADVGVHESTVSRAVAHRYVDTPHGVFALRSFFSNRLPGDPAGIVSSLAARQRMREIVAAEDPACPLADGEIAGALAAAGVRIARRTVVKYRDLLGIATAPTRRCLTA